MPNRILLALNGSPMDAVAILEAKRLAAGGADVHLLHVVPSRGVPAGSPLLGSASIEPVPVGATGASGHVTGRLPAPPGGRDDGESWIQQQTAGYLSRLRRELGDIHGQEIVRTGDPADALLDVALAFNIDLIVMSTHARSGLARWFLGSTAETVLRRSQLPVLLVRRGVPPASRELRRILVPLDGSEPAKAILSAVKPLAVRTRAEVILLHVNAGPSAGDRPPAWLQETAAALAAPEISIRPLAAAGRVAETILREAQALEVDLIAMSTRARRGRRGPSVSRRVLAKAGMPVLLQEPVIHGERAGSA